MEKTKQSNADNKVIKVRIRKPKAEPAANTLFSDKDVRRIVMDFVSSWIRGDIIIRFPTAAELAKKTPLAIKFPTDPAIDQELKIKEHYIELLLTSAGLNKASAQEQDKAIKDVFHMMLMFRSANRIEGKIQSNDLERRIQALEEKQQATAKLVEQITGFLFKEPAEKKQTP
jgi:hypothetical protein